MCFQGEIKDAVEKAVQVEVLGTITDTDLNESMRSLALDEISEQPFEVLPDENQQEQETSQVRINTDLIEYTHSLKHA